MNYMTEALAKISCLDPARQCNVTNNTATTVRTHKQISDKRPESKSAKSPVNPYLLNPETRNPETYLGVSENSGYAILGSF